MLVPILLAAMIAILLAHAYPLRRGAADEPVRRTASAPLAPLPRAHAVDARHWNSAYWD